MSTRACDLCGEDATARPLSQRIGEEEKRFCCIGCMNVYVILFESGVVASGQDLRSTDLFRRSLAMGFISQRDAPQPAASQTPGETKEMLLQVSGMWCSACAWLIEHSLEKVAGVARAEVFFASDLVKVAYDPVRVVPDALTQRVTRLGYSVSELGDDRERSSDAMRDLLLRFGVAAFFWLNVMTLSAVLYVGYFEPIAASARTILPFVLMVLSLPVISYSAFPILRVAFHGLRNLTVRMETLLAIGILAAFAYSVFETFRGGTHLYFDTATAIVTFVLAGKLLERASKDQTMKSISRLHRMMPTKARLVADDQERFVSVASLSAGDLILVKAGERIPADGVVVDGSCDADESLLTGESIPVPKGAGSAVVSGSANLGGVIQVHVTRACADSALSRIIALVEQAVNSRSLLERAVDRIARVFVPLVLLLATATFAVSWSGGSTDPGDALLRAIAVLVIACPCALGLATPLAVTAAVDRASGEGILVGDARLLERVRTLDAVVFDKTGTLTAGEFSLLHATNRDRDLLSAVAAVEHYSEHPLGRAIVRFAESEDIRLAPASQVEIRKGEGIRGEVDGSVVFAGNRRLLRRLSIALDAESEARAIEWEREGLTVVFCGRDGRLEAMLALGDRLRTDARDVVRELTARGIRTMIVSGDSEETTARTAALVGVDEFRAGATPDDKVAFVKTLQRLGFTVGMIGDGINDSPALAQADLGIALASGAEIAMKSAAVVLMGDSLTKILDAIDLSRQTWRIVRQNLFWAFFYNTLGITLAMTGTLNPLLAAGAMLASSACVVGNSRRLARRATTSTPSRSRTPAPVPV